jgi:hypothetical protein
MFAPAVEYVRSISHLLFPGVTYSGEVLAKPKHNVLCYDRTPKNGIILFDIRYGLEHYEKDYNVKAMTAKVLGLEVVPRIYEGKIENLGQFREFLERASILGGQKVEGVVVKNYRRFGRDGKALMGKFVSEAFKEVHNHEWKSANPNAGDVVEKLIASYRTPARWDKAIQHLREAGQLSGEPKDIAKIIPEVTRDLEEECGEEIRDLLFKWAFPKVSRAVIGGVAEHYKEILLKQQFEVTAGASAPEESAPSGSAESASVGVSPKGCDTASHAPTAPRPQCVSVWPKTLEGA